MVGSRSRLDSFSSGKFRRYVGNALDKFCKKIGQFLSASIFRFFFFSAISSEGFGSTRIIFDRGIFFFLIFRVGYILHFTCPRYYDCHFCICYSWNVDKIYEQIFHTILRLLIEKIHICSNNTNMTKLCIESTVAWVLFINLTWVPFINQIWILFINLSTVYKPNVSTVYKPTLSTVYKPSLSTVYKPNLEKTWVLFINRTLRKLEYCLWI